MKQLPVTDDDAAAEAGGGHSLTESIPRLDISLPPTEVADDDDIIT